MPRSFKIGVIGLGYVGLPIAIEFSKYFDVVGFDINKGRISSLKSGIDFNEEEGIEKIKKNKIFFTDKSSYLKYCNIYIITVPTPVNKKNLPDLYLIKKATENVAKYINRKDILIYESTVYPGFTEEVLIPLIEKKTKLKLNSDFYCGYSPERINPGDKNKTLKNINKIVSGSNKYSLNIIYNLYKKIISAKVIKVNSIKIAESAKVIENCQRDINIAFMNELFMIFSKLNINFFKVLDAAKTKWNFLNFVPGLVGGHCIGVDPYYLAYKAKKIGHDPQIILSGRKINNLMPKFYASMISKNKKNKSKLKTLILGATFKEDCKDLRNSKVLDFYNELKIRGHKVDIFDPMFSIKYKLFNDNILNIKPKINSYNNIILAVKHDKFKKLGIRRILKWGKNDCKFFDIKNFFKKI